MLCAMLAPWCLPTGSEPLFDQPYDLQTSLMVEIVETVMKLSGTGRT